MEKKTVRFKFKTTVTLQQKSRFTLRRSDSSETVWDVKRKVSSRHWLSVFTWAQFLHRWFLKGDARIVVAAPARARDTRQCQVLLKAFSKSWLALDF